VIHHPIQMTLPDVCSHFCWNENMAITTRRTVLDRAARQSATVIAAHFAGPTAVQVVRDGDAWMVGARR